MRSRCTEPDVRTRPHVALVLALALSCACGSERAPESERAAETPSAPDPPPRDDFEDDPRLVGRTEPVCEGPAPSLCELPGHPGVRARSCNWREELGPLGSGGATHDLELSAGGRYYDVEGGTLAGTFAPAGEAPLLAVVERRLTHRTCHGGIDACVIFVPRLLLLRPEPRGLVLVETVELPGGGQYLARALGSRLVLDHDDGDHCAVVDASGAVLDGVECSPGTARPARLRCADRTAPPDRPRTLPRDPRITDPLEGLEGL